MEEKVEEIKSNEAIKEVNTEANIEAKRGPGRPKGSLDRSKSPRNTRLRVRLCRQRKAEIAEQQMELEAETERSIDWYRKNGFCFFGEISPGVNAASAEQELMLAREYAEALHLPDIRTQSVRQYVIEVLNCWITTGAKHFNRASRVFDFTEFKKYVRPEMYQFPESVDESYQIENEVNV